MSQCTSQDSNVALGAPRPMFRPSGRAASYSGAWTYAGYGHGQRLCIALGQ